MSKHKAYQQFTKLTVGQWQMLAFLTMLEKYRSVPSQPVAEIIDTVGPKVDYPKLMMIHRRLKKWTNPVKNTKLLEKLRLMRLYAWTRVPKLQLLNWWYRRYVHKLEKPITIEISKSHLSWLKSLSATLVEDVVMLTRTERKELKKALNDATTNQLTIVHS